MKHSEMEGTSQVRERLREIMDVEGLSLRVIAPQIGVSFGALGPWMNGSYSGTSDNVTRKVQEFFERRAELEAMPVSEEERFPVTVQTGVLAAVTKAIRSCHLKGKIGIVTAPSGSGKTRACKAYSDQYTGVIFVECHHSFPARMVLLAIAQACGVEERGSIHELLEGICAKLKGSGWVLILDEAEHLKSSVLDTVRRLNDWAGIGIVYVGLPRFMAQMQNLRRDYSYIWNRVRVRAGISRDRAAELADTALLLESVIGDVPAGVADAFHAFCGGDMRRLEELFYTCLEASRVLDMPISTGIVAASAKKLDMEAV